MPRRARPHGAPTLLALAEEVISNVQPRTSFAALHMSAPGTSRQFDVTHGVGRYRAHSGQNGLVALANSVEVDPTRLLAGQICCDAQHTETVVIATAGRKIIGHVKQESPFCPDIAATPDGNQVWLTLKDVGKAMVFNARQPFDILKVIDTGSITNHVNIARNVRGKFAYVTVGGLNVVKVFKTDTFEQVATIPTGALPHGLWPSGDGTRVYVGLENADGAAAIDTLENKVLDTIAVGQAPQRVAYVPNAVPQGDGTQNLQPLGVGAS